MELSTLERKKVICTHCNAGHARTYLISDGIELSYFTLTSETTKFCHAPLPHVIEINYCRAGRIGWKLGNDASVYLGPGDFCIHTMETCAHSQVTLPTGSYEGMTICIDLETLAKQPPELLTGTNLTLEPLLDKFCKNHIFSSFAGNEKTDAIFQGFYDQPQAFQQPYRIIKTWELLLYLGKMNPQRTQRLNEYQAEQVTLIRQIHAQLIQNLDKRFTIEELSRQYLINTTTLKNGFKAIYGASIAAHVKIHRMEYAAKCLRETSAPVTTIAKEVGYDSQSKFTAAFKDIYHMTPREYRQQHS